MEFTINKHWLIINHNMELIISLYIKLILVNNFWYKFHSSLIYLARYLPTEIINNSRIKLEEQDLHQSDLIFIHRHTNQDILNKLVIYE